MRLTLRRKIILALSLFFFAGASLWLLNYYKHSILNLKLQILEKKDDLFNTILEARRYEKNYFLYNQPQNLEEALAYARQAEQKLSEIITRYGSYTIDKTWKTNWTF